MHDESSSRQHETQETVDLTRADAPSRLELFRPDLAETVGGAASGAPLRARTVPAPADAAAARPAGTSAPAVVLCAVFFLSGVSALIFETLWFRLAGLAFGNGVWASALVLSSFMAGLALGNGLAARHGHRVRRPERLYAGIELAVAASGILLVVAFPGIAGLLARVFRPLLDHPLALNASRLTIAFLLLMVPATAMGATLPLLVKALHARKEGFGSSLGKLYGWNTLGALAGALLAETVFIGRFGLVGTGLAAGAFDVIAAAGALALGGMASARPEAQEVAARVALSHRARRLLAAGFLSGGILLALEVVWFRFLQLFFPGTTLTFTMMLAVVLGGIGLGGLAGSFWFRRDADAHRFAPAVAAAAALVSVLVYRSFDVVLGARTEAWSGGYGLEGLPLCLFLMLPVSLLSGLLFSLVGSSVHRHLRDATRAAGLATMCNTLGATLGPLVAGFVLVPWLGMERSFFVLALLYGATFLLLLDRTAHRTGSVRYADLGLGAALVVGLALFPFGHMQRYLGIASAGHRRDGSEVVATREGLTETIQYLRKDFLGRPLWYRLVTNGFSMSGTNHLARRYMKYYVYWPVAVHPHPREALLISFGTGSTAKALTDTSALESIVVVDVSREILEMANVVFPEDGTNPLDDPRVETRVEDGRFYLQATDRRFDIITSEPPPPKLAGVVNLYTREYFQLIRDRLAEGGIATYWLPVVQLDEAETRSVLRAFFEVFGDEATVWTGSGLNWMLVGTRDAAGPVPERRFAAQWSDPVVAPELHDLGFETPAQIGATFLMGPEDLRTVTEGVAPLTDDRPRRLSQRIGTDPKSIAFYAEWMSPREACERFERSDYIRHLWPESTRKASAEFFPFQEAINRITAPELRGEIGFGLLHGLLSSSPLEIPVLWASGSSAEVQSILAEVAPGQDEDDGRVSYQLAMGAMARRDYVDAERLLARSFRISPRPELLSTRLYLLCAAGRADEAHLLVDEHPEWFAKGAGGGAFLDWVTDTVGFE